MTDVERPGLSGYALAAELRCLRPVLPVLFVSGFDERRTRQQHEALSRSRFLTKPFEVSALAEAVRALTAVSQGRAVSTAQPSECVG